MLALLLLLQISAELAFPPAILNLQRVIAESVEGKAIIAKFEAARIEHEKVLSAKRAEIQTLIEKKATAATVERSQVELQRMTEDAEVQLSDLQRALQVDFFKKVEPLAIQIAAEDKLGILFTFPNPNIIWTAPTVDITLKLIERLDAAKKKSPHGNPQ
jgi:Skp family chaperone for outer membrane proteins